jgi:phosphomannomutase
VTAAGGEALLFDRSVPTPVLAYSVRRLGADAGVAVTASHNPPVDNGYKVYLGDGAQIVPPSDAHIAAAIDAAAERDLDLAAGEWETLGDEAVDAYLAMAVGVVGTDGPRHLAIVYTPLHGVGGDLTTRALTAAGFPAPIVVGAQFEPDPDFPTVSFPNPEEPGALDLALDEARRSGADLIIANDPDADRLAVAVPDPHRGGEWRALTGNEVGALLADRALTTTDGPDRLVVTTVVSSRLLAAMARMAGIHYAETLTGFKWIMRAAVDRPDLHFVFGYEEALGYAVTDEVRDKDGITAALAFAALAAGLRAEGRSVVDRLDDLARTHGLHVTGQVTIPGFGVADRLRQAPPDEIAGRRVTEIVDLLDGGDLPPTDGVVFDVAGDVRVVVRPSGTEPKTKAYIELVRPVDGDVAAARRAAADDLAELAGDLRARLAT